MKDLQDRIQEYHSPRKIWTVDEVDDLLRRELLHAEVIKTRKMNDFLPDGTKVRVNRTIEYFNVACSFDIETTSTEVNGKKVAFMYVWQFAINDYVIMGRTWDEFTDLLNKLSTFLQLSEERILVVYVHSLAYEFQFIRKRLKWASVFSLDEREPVRALSTLGVEFRCSYKLSGYSLATLAKNLQYHSIRKLEGDLDYTKIRTADTPLTDEEIGYCVNDVLIVTAYINECIEQEGNITKIPLTNTGYVRRDCRNNCLPSGRESKKQFNHYCKLMKCLTIEPDEYKQLKRAFQGGFTHANAFYTGEVCENVGSYDFTSSYPSVMFEKFPMSKGRVVEPKTATQFKNYLKNFCCIFDVEFFDVESTSLNENPLSYSKCIEVEKAVVNNGRIVSAKHLKTTMTEVDFHVFNKFYRASKMTLGTFRVYHRGYLPKELILSVLDFYDKKTTLKDVEGMEVEYMLGKGRLNSIYGCIVTDICRDTIEYSQDEWKSVSADIDKCMDSYNNNIMRFLYFPWGIYITSYARRNLFSGIYEFGDDYRYSDTDSIKAVNCENHQEYINAYNEDVQRKIEACLHHYNIPIERAHPKSKDGVKRPLGVWTWEGVYSKFKTLGSKRYMVLKDGKYNITVSGLNKGKCVPYIIDKSKELNISPFDFFAEGMFIPPEYTGKMTHSYLDYSQDMMIQDYLGNTSEVHELSSVHLSGAEYSMSLARDYLNYLRGIRDKKYV